jgi:DNA invertase Pin-like site-specific DNA recombinase|tara:strand:+ start:404 stop:2503 length:2100 start_codon:yes stop_codon:yes gene_type:complete
MNGSGKIKATHLNRLAVVYLRQSDPKQVRENRESAVNQRALQERLREFNWKQNQISIVDGDQGKSAKHAEGREGFQTLVADVGLGKIGIIMGYEVSRLARNCADWHRLLELCALFDTLIGDSDGIYNPRDFNDRLLLGLKGTMSEAELHSLRLRLDAGRISKAKRAELIQHLPTGLVRSNDGEVAIHPDKSVEDRIRLVFEKFAELGSGSKVLKYFVRNELKLPRHQTSGLYAGEILWKAPTLSALHSILKNPAYAGAFAHGRRQADPTKQIPGRPATGRLRRPQDEWIALVKDAYPAYISWQEYEKNQQTIAENQERMQNETFKKKGQNCNGAALLAKLVYCAKCGRKMRVQYKDNRFQYVCSKSRNELATGSCQFISGCRIDDSVVAEFFKALAPAQIDALAAVLKKQSSGHQQQLKHLRQEVSRLEYAATRAERQYNNVDPENRLIASSLESKWEHALADLELAKSKLADTEAEKPQVTRIPNELRESFADVGQRLPELWSRLANDVKKALLGAMICKVNLLRDEGGVAQIRIVWQGKLVTEVKKSVPVHSLRYSKMEQRVAETMRQLTAKGATQDEIIKTLNERHDLHPCRGGAFTSQIVSKLKRRFGIVSNLERVRRGEVEIRNVYTITQMAEETKMDPSWIYRKIGKGAIRIKKDATYGCYLFPRTKKCVKELNRLRKGTLTHVDIRELHHSG